MNEPRARKTAVRVRSKVWIERDGAVLMSEYRARLLEAIMREGSVAAAADSLSLPNRTAWKKLREIEEAAGVKPVALLEIGTDPPLETVIFWRSSAVLVRPDSSMIFWSMRTTGEMPAVKAVSVVGM